MLSMKLEKPLFYKNKFALRFELGPTDISVWADSKRENINEEYFRVASNRAASIYRSAFSQNDEIKVCYQILSDGRQKIKKSDYFFKLFCKLSGKPIVFSEHRDIYRDDLEYKRYCIKRVTISDVYTQDLNEDEVILALINSDFGCRGPSLHGQLFLINCTKGLTLHIYDDRGMDIVADSKKPLESIYHEQNSSLLDYDRDYMDRLFALT
ncbi:DUF3885 domain-containing protein [Veronia pacifica]|uniref:DUF3885 domain-containing protein n=2 Tax=Veronia pacifica TaxID=1080227 RepID=A0A1C3E7W1_9GAMM|nr:hypothetical protein A8L45_22390 [Veronia pacifica]